MNKVCLQLWVDFSFGDDVIPDGCSIHLDDTSKDLYINDVYKNRTEEIPQSYEAFWGDSIRAYIDDELYDVLDRVGVIRLTEYEMNNLISLTEIIINDEDV